jgi:hypothetical protein
MPAVAHDANQKWAVMSPEGLPLGATGAVSRPLGILEGKTIGEVYNNHFRGELMFQTYRRLFQERYPGIRIIPFDQFPIVYVGGDAASQKKVAREIAALAKEKGCDAIITGNGG